MHESLRTRSSSPDQKFGDSVTSLTADGQYVRTLIYTGFIEPHQSAESLLEAFASDFYEAPWKDKIFCVGSKAISIIQGRYRRINDIHPNLFSRMATHFGTQTEYGMGVAGHPAKLQAAIDEVGLPRILAASAASTVEKLGYSMGLLKDRKGFFYKIAGKKVEAIDGLVPDGGYKNHIILYPDDPTELCKQLEHVFHIPNAIVDVNDIGGSILALSPSSPYNREQLYAILADNPFGQDKRRTPIAIVGKNK